MGNDYFSAGISSMDAAKAATEMNTLSNMAYHMAATQKLGDETARMQAFRNYASQTPDAFLQMQGGNQTAAELARQLAMVNPEWIFKSAGSPHVMGGSMATFFPLLGNSEIQATSQNLKEGETTSLGGNIGGLIRYQYGQTDPLKPLQIQGSNLTGKLREYEYALKQGFKGSFEDWTYTTKDRPPTVHIGGGDKEWSKFMRGLQFAEAAKKNAIAEVNRQRIPQEGGGGWVYPINPATGKRFKEIEFHHYLEETGRKAEERALKLMGVDKIMDAYKTANTPSSENPSQEKVDAEYVTDPKTGKLVRK